MEKGGVVTTNEFDEIAIATEIASRAHAGQEDKAGESYILHPLRVGLSLHKQGFGPWIVASGILHDAVEDGGPEIVAEIQDRLPKHIFNLVDTVSRRQGETYEDFIHRISFSSFGTAVKIADLHDNLSRWKQGIDPSGSLQVRYTNALNKLNGTWKI